MQKFNWLFILFTIMTLFLSGCSSNAKKPEISTVDAVEGDTAAEASAQPIADLLRQRVDPLSGDPSWAPVRPPEQDDGYTATTGSLYDVAQIRDLYNDSKPRGIGDIITVMLEEKNQATKSANTALNKTTAMTMDPIKMGGKDVTLGDSSFSYDVNNNNDFKGTNATDQSNSLKGAISVEVIEVLPNGNLRVRGEKWLTLNAGDEYIRLSGTIRPDDIDPKNNIASTRISNARIQYSGTGERQDIQEQNILGRYFNIVM